VKEVMPFEEWLSSTDYTENVKAELREVRRRIETTTGLPKAKQCLRVKSHIKNESYDDVKELRWINARPDCYKVFAGPVAKTIEEQVYKIEHFIKHVPVPDRPKRILAMRAAGRRYYENDYTSWEARNRPRFQHAVEMQLLWWVCGDCAPHLCRLIEKVETGVNHLHVFAGVSCDVEGERMSGTSFTSVFNGFGNLMLFKYICRCKNMAGGGYVEGDDGLFWCEGSLAESDFERLGFVAKIVELRDPCLGHFCGMTFTEDGTIMKDPRRVFRTFGWTQSFMGAGNQIMDELLRAKGLSLAYELPQCPILGALSRRAIELTSGVNIKHWPDQWSNTDHDTLLSMQIPDFAPTRAAREMMSQLYGISPDVQLKVEELIRNDDYDQIQSLIPPSAVQSKYVSAYIEIT